MPDEIVDACCLINLYAAGEINTFLSVLGDSFHVPSIVVGESFYVVRPDKDDPAKMVSEKIDRGTAGSGVVLRDARLDVAAGAGAQRTGGRPLHVPADHWTSLATGPGVGARDRSLGGHGGEPTQDRRSEAGKWGIPAQIAAIDWERTAARS